MRILTDTAFLFPGQGAQHTGMLKELAGEHPEVRETFDAASAVFGKDLFALAMDGPEEALNRTVNTQPVMLAAGVAVWRIWSRLSDAVPAVAAGHSFGEYTALVCAGSIAFEDAVAIAAKRGELMQQAVAEGRGAMAAIIGLKSRQVVELCAAPGGEQVVEAVNFNAPTQTVIAGHKAAVEEAMARAKAQGARKCVALPVSVPAHSSLMRDAAREFSSFLKGAEISAPAVKILHNVDAMPRTIPGDIFTALSEQLYNPVQWVGTIERMGEDGVTRFVELGPGQVLTNLVRRINKRAECHAVNNPAGLERALAEFG